jgi:hypothetical protein
MLCGTAGSRTVEGRVQRPHEFSRGVAGEQTAFLRKNTVFTPLFEKILFFKHSCSRHDGANRAKPKRVEKPAAGSKKIFFAVHAFALPAGVTPLPIV